MKRFVLGRRAMLRASAGGLTAAIGLPVLDAMLDGSGTAHADGTPAPRRFGLWFFCNGVILKHWLPRPGSPSRHFQNGREVGTVDTTFTLGEELAPFEEEGVRQQTTIVSGTRLFGWSRGQVAHHSVAIGALTGDLQEPTGRPFELRRLGPCIADVVADRWEGATPIRMLNASVDGNVADSEAERDPRAMFDRVFGADLGEPMPWGPRRSRRSILDLVLGETERLQARLGRDDRIRLDGHLAGIRELERSIAELPPVCRLDPAPTEVHRSGSELVGEVHHEAYHDAFADILAHALAADKTRVFCVTHGGPQSETVFADSGVARAHHDLTHTEPHVDDDQPLVHRTIVWRMRQLARLTRRLADVRDCADRSVLDNTLVYATTDTDQGFTHYGIHQPILLLGRSGGTVRGGVHYSGYVGDHPTCSSGGPEIDSNQENAAKVLLTILRALGFEDTEWGVNDPAPVLTADGWRNLGWGHVTDVFDAVLSG